MLQPMKHGYPSRHERFRDKGILWRRCCPSRAEEVAPIGGTASYTGPSYAWVFGEPCSGHDRAILIHLTIFAMPKHDELLTPPTTTATWTTVPSRTRAADQTRCNQLTWNFSQWLTSEKSPSRSRSKLQTKCCMFNAERERDVGSAESGDGSLRTHIEVHRRMACRLRNIANRCFKSGYTTNSPFRSPGRLSPYKRNTWLWRWPALPAPPTTAAVTVPAPTFPAPAAAEGWPED